MAVDLLKIISRGVCTFGATVNRDQDGYGSVVASKASDDCPETCDYCRHMANHILSVIEAAKVGDPESSEDNV